MGLFLRRAAEIWRDYVTTGIPATGAHQPVKSQIRDWGATVESALEAIASTGSLIYSNRAELYADLAQAPNTQAWVIADPTASYNGVYKKSGASGSGSWLRMSDLPFAVIPLVVSGGTANAITATSILPVPQADNSAILLLTPTATNTDVVTIAINGAAPKELRGKDGSVMLAGYLKAGHVVAMVQVASTYRTINDFRLDSFNRVQILGGNLLTATQPTDVLTIEAGANISIETDVVNRKLRIIATNGAIGAALGFTAGSVVFAGSTGAYAQNNDKFFWDNAASTLRIGSMHFKAGDVSNTLIGTNTGASLTQPASSHNGDGNTLVGVNVAPVATSMFATTIVGGNSGSALTIGDSNTIVGYQNGLALTTGKWNVLMGVDVMISDTASANNVVIGHHTGTNMTFGSGAGEVVIIGAEAVKVGVGAVAATGVGYRVLYNSNASAVGNTSVGHLSMFTNTSGTLNVALGKEALFSNTTGQSNAGMGYRALWNNITGNYNAGFGAFAGFSNTAGNSNVFFGNNAGFYETGSNKLFIDNVSRSNEADGRAKALLYGEFGATPDVQKLVVNGQLIGRGTPTNDSAASGTIGEFLPTNVAYPGSSLTSGTAANLASQAVSGGNYLVWLDVTFEPAATTTVSSLIASIGTTSAALNTTPGAISYHSQASAAPGAAVTCTVGPFEVKVAAGGGTIYGVARASFATSTMTAWGSLRVLRNR